MTWVHDGEGGIMPQPELLHDRGVAHRWNPDRKRDEFWNIFKGCWVANKYIGSFWMHGPRCGVSCAWLVSYEDTWAEPAWPFEAV